MFKRIHTFESYGELDMPIYNDVSISQFKQYMYIPEVKDLVNRLNNYWWEMENDDTSDEALMQQYGAEFERMEQEIKEVIKKHEDNNIDDEKENLISEFIEDLNNAGINVKIISEELHPEIKLTIDINDEEYDIVINDRGDVKLHDSDYIVHMGNVYEYKALVNKFKEMLSLYGDDYIKFLQNYSI
jgi:hypothetical protein